MDKITYVVSGKTDPYYNLALEEWMLKNLREGETLLFLWQNENTIVIGRNQDAYAECRVDDFLRDRGKIARRHSGGGAVFHDLGNLCFSIISHENEKGKELYRDMVMGVTRAWGIHASFNGKNDFLAEGKKFCGSAGYTDGKNHCFHGTFLICSDIGKISRYLTPSVDKLRRNHVASVEARVGNLADAKPGITVRMAKDALIRYTGAMPPTWEPEEEKIAILKEKLEKKDWIFGGQL